jgi:hypothetical protein
VFFGSAAELFLGAQGDPWDTQACLLLGMGASVALLPLSRAHDTALLRLPFPVYGAKERGPDESSGWSSRLWESANRSHSVRVV